MSAVSRSALFLGLALAAALAATGPKLDALADASFTWHMAQHLTLLYGVPLCILLSSPFAIVARFLGKAATAAAVRAVRPLHVLSAPPVALAVFLCTLWATHCSGFYDLALRVPIVHAFEHLAYVAAGTLFWLPVVAPPPLRPLPYPVRLLYLLVALPQGALLGVALTAARHPLYAHYARSAPAMAALADQRDGAALMWIVGGAVTLTAFLATVGAWAARERRSQVRPPSERYARTTALLAFAAVALAPIVLRAQDGRQLYATNCSSCHGIAGQGSNLAPPLVGKNASDVHLMLDTGQMPASAPGVNEIHRKNGFTDAETNALVRYVMGFSSTADRSLPVLSTGSIWSGRKLFVENCAACHGAVGDGASVGANDAAPPLRGMTAFQIAEAARAGPGVMPRFGSDVLSDADVSDIARYVVYIHSKRGEPVSDAGGAPLAHVGPVAEGLVAWVFGLGGLVVFLRAIGSPRR